MINGKVAEKESDSASIRNPWTLTRDEVKQKYFPSELSQLHRARIQHLQEACWKARTRDRPNENHITELQWAKHIQPLLAVPSTFSHPGLGPAKAVLNRKNKQTQIRKK
jgi:hypothetical protein